MGSNHDKIVTQLCYPQEGLWCGKFVSIGHE